MRGTNGAYVPVNNGGSISGALTDTLNFSSVTFADAADYVLMATNSAGSAFSSVAHLTVLSLMTNVVTPDSTVSAFGDEAGTFYGASGGVTNAIDGTLTKYVNGGSGFSASAGFPPFNGPVGIIITPSEGTLVTGMRIYASDATPNADPADYTLEGSNNGGNTFTVISSGPLNLPLARNTGTNALDPATQSLQEVLFPNTLAYTVYRVTFNNVRNGTLAGNLQIGEIELLGVPGTPVLEATLTVTRDFNVLVFTSSAPGTLQSTTELKSSGTVWQSEGTITDTLNKTIDPAYPAKFYRVLIQ
jgi:hypothetical protein